MIEDNPGDACLIQDMLADAKNIEFEWSGILDEAPGTIGMPSNIVLQSAVLH